MARPITREEDLADREDEKRSVRGDVVSGQAVMLHAPRRYGKTSLARVVAEGLQEEGTQGTAVVRRAPKFRAGPLPPRREPPSKRRRP